MVISPLAPAAWVSSPAKMKTSAINGSIRRLKNHTSTNGKGKGIVDRTISTTHGDITTRGCSFTRVEEEVTTLRSLTSLTNNDSVQTAAITSFTSDEEIIDLITKEDLTLRNTELSRSVRCETRSEDQVTTISISVRVTSGNIKITTSIFGSGDLTLKKSVTTRTRARTTGDHQIGGHRGTEDNASLFFVVSEVLVSITRNEVQRSTSTRALTTHDVEVSSGSTLGVLSLNNGGTTISSQEVRSLNVDGESSSR